jgi:hypothetical protein
MNSQPINNFAPRSHVTVLQGDFANDGVVGTKLLSFFSNATPNETVRCGQEMWFVQILTASLLIPN